MILTLAGQIPEHAEVSGVADCGVRLIDARDDQCDAQCDAELRAVRDVTDVNVSTYRGLVYANDGRDNAQGGLFHAPGEHGGVSSVLYGDYYRQ